MLLPYLFPVSAAAATVADEELFHGLDSVSLLSELLA